MMKWFKETTGELVGDFEANCMPSSYGGNCICPLCGQEAVWWEGQIDETLMGEAIYGENQVCYPARLELKCTNSIDPVINRD